MEYLTLLWHLYRFYDSDSLKERISGILAIEGRNVTVLDEEKLRGEVIDDLIYTAVFSSAPETKGGARWLIRRAGTTMGIVASSIQSFYDAMGKKEVAGFTVPAINLRGITYYSALPATLRSRVRLTLAMTRFMTCFEIVNIKPISNQKNRLTPLSTVVIN